MVLTRSWGALVALALDDPPQVKSEVAVEFGLSYWWVHELSLSLGNTGTKGNAPVTHRGPLPRSEGELEAALRLVNDAVDVLDTPRHRGGGPAEAWTLMSRRLGVRVKYVKALWAELGLPVPSQRFTCVSDEVFEKMVYAVGDEWSKREIANTFGVSMMTVDYLFPGYRGWDPKNGVGMESAELQRSNDVVDRILRGKGLEV